MTAPRRAAQVITDWLQNTMLRSVLDTQRGQEIRIRRLEARMPALENALRQFRADVDAETSRIGEQLAAMQSRLEAGDASAAAQVSAELGPVVESLRALGTGSPADPVPAPDAEGGGDVPAGV